MSSAAFQQTPRSEASGVVFNLFYVLTSGLAIHALRCLSILFHPCSFVVHVRIVLRLLSIMFTGKQKSGVLHSARRA